MCMVSFAKYDPGSYRVTTTKRKPSLEVGRLILKTGMKKIFILNKNLILSRVWLKSVLFHARIAHFQEH